MARKCVWGLLLVVATAFVLTCSSGWFLNWYGTTLIHPAG